LDATLGLGGHAEAVLEKIGPQGRLIGLDRDPQALERAQDRLRRFGEQVKLIHGHFGQLAEHLQSQQTPPLDAAYFDLGVSSLQLDSSERGFSFAKPGPLDMRMNPEEELTAAQIINHASQEELTALIRSLGEEHWAGRIARAIVDQRPFQTTTALAEIIRQAVPKSMGSSRIDPATRTFQAIRIAVNRELELLPQGLRQALQHLKPNGRIGVLAYHSLEDRITKKTFQEQVQAGCAKMITRKPIRPSEAEVDVNPRARSARLRVAQKISSAEVPG